MSGSEQRAPARWRGGRGPQAAGAGRGRRGPRPRGLRWVARGRGGRRLAAGLAGGAGGDARRAGHPAARPRPCRSSPRPARAPAAARPQLAATMSTGLRYKSKLATPGEPGARPRARARLCPRCLPVSHRVSPSLSRPPARKRPDPDPDPTPTQQRTSRYVRAAHSAGCHLLWHQSCPRPGTTPPPPAVTPPCRDNRLSAWAVLQCLGLQMGGVGAIHRGLVSDPHSRSVSPTQDVGASQVPFSHWSSACISG